MTINEIINKIGKDKIIHWILLFSVGLFIVGIFEFIYIWEFRYQLKDYLKFAGDYSFQTFFIQFIQVYSVLFIPLISFIGFKYRNSLRFNLIKLPFIVLLMFIFQMLIFSYHPYGLWEWAFLFMSIFIIISLKFNLIFAFSFSYLSFYSANMLFEFQGLNFLKSFGTLLSYLMIFGMLIFILYRLRINFKKYKTDILLSFIPIVFMWIYFYPIWQLKGNSFYNAYLPYDLYIRIFTFPFYITISLIIYFTYRKHGKSYILNTIPYLNKEKPAND